MEDITLYIHELASSDLVKQQSAIEALVKIGAPAVHPLINTLRPLRGISQIKSLLGSSKPNVPILAAEALAKIGSPAVDALISSLNDSDEVTRSRMVNILVQIGQPAVDNLVMNLLSASANKNARLATIEILSKIGSSVVESIILQLRQRDPWDIFMLLDIVDVFVRIGTGAVEPLIKGLGDSNINVRQVAVMSLSHIPDARSVEPLIGLLQDSNVDIQGPAMAGLGKIGDPRAVEPLMKFLNDPNSYVRAGAVSALGDIGDERALPKLEEMMRDDKAKLDPRDWECLASSMREMAMIASKKIRARKRTKNDLGHDFNRLKS